MGGTRGGTRGQQEEGAYVLYSVPAQGVGCRVFLASPAECLWP